MKSNPVYEMPSNEYNKQLAFALKEIPEFKQPEWVAFVKSGVAKKRPSQEKDFWYKRAASILRQIYIHKLVGVNKLRTRYGSKKNRGMKPERFKKASGKIIRVILQQAESAEFLEKYSELGEKAGRRLTKKGREFLESIEIEDKGKLTDMSKDKQLHTTENKEALDSIKDNKIEEKIEKTEKDLAKDITKIEDKVEEKEITQKQADKEIKEDVKEDVEGVK